MILLFEFENYLANAAYSLKILLEEKERLQELNFIIFYASAINGDEFFLDMLDDARDNLKKYEDLPDGGKSACIDLPHRDLRIGRTTKRYIRFLVKAGIIESERDTRAFVEKLSKFFEILQYGPFLPQKTRMSASELLDLVNGLEEDYLKIRAKEQILARKFLGSETVAKIAITKRY